MRTFIIIAAFLISNSIFEANDKIISNEMFVFYIGLILFAILLDVGIWLDKRKDNKKIKELENDIEAINDNYYDKNGETLI